MEKDVFYNYSDTVTEAEDLAIQKTKSKVFRELGLTSLGFGAVFSFCLFRNPNGITMPVFAVLLLVLSNYIIRKNDFTVSKKSKVFEVIIVLLAVSDFCTANMHFVILNNIGMYLIFLIFMISVTLEVKEWTFGKLTSTLLKSVFKPVAFIGTFFSDFAAFCVIKKNKSDVDISKSSNRERIIRSVTIGVLIAAPLLFIVTGLLASADAVFSSFIDGIVKYFYGIEIDYSMMELPFMFVFGAVGFYLVLRMFISRGVKVNSDSKPADKDPVIAITALSLISVVYLIFSVIQIMFLFTRNFTLPEGYTYAEYAREGFFQLLFVCIMNLFMVVFVLARFGESTVLKVILTIISACTYIMIASSAMRMLLYISEYHLTLSRIIVLWMLSFLLIFMTVVVVSIYKKNVPLFSIGVITFSIMYLALSFSHVDYFIAKYNLSKLYSYSGPISFQADRFGFSLSEVVFDYRTEKSAEIKALEEKNKELKKEWHESCIGIVDFIFEKYGEPITSDEFRAYEYVYSLSSDAAPAIAEYSGEWVDEFFIVHTDKKLGIRTLNISELVARSVKR